MARRTATGGLALLSLSGKERAPTGQLLVTSIGKPQRGYELRAYRLADRDGSNTYRSEFAPVALAHLLPVLGKALILRTEESGANADRLQKELEAAELVVAQEEIVASPVRDLLTQVVRLLDEHLPQAGELVLDITYGFRHLPMVYSTALSFFSALREDTRYTAYYAMGQSPDSSGVVPIVEVTDAHRLVQWHYAAASARISGDLRPLARLLRQDVSSLFKRGQRATDLSALKDAAERLAESLAMGLPLEAGVSAGGLLEVLGSLEDGPATPGDLAAKALRQEIEPWALSCRTNKKEIQWSRKEIERQLALARFWCEKGDLPAALLLLREILVSLSLHPEERARWLDLRVRKEAEGALNASGERAKAGIHNDRSQSVASIWQSVRDARNELAHSGMRAEEVRLEREKARGLVEDVKQLIGADAGAARDEGGGKMLISPFGLSPGVLFTALRHVGRVNHLMVVTSAGARDRVSEAIEKAGQADLPVTILVMKEPHTGYDEAQGMLEQASADGPRTVREQLAMSERVVTNLVGGTTAMQVVVEQLAAQARRLGVSTRRVAVIDRRSPEEQRADPYVVGEAVWLDEDESSAFDA